MEITNEQFNALMSKLDNLEKKVSGSTQIECRFTVAEWAEEWFTTYKLDKVQPSTAVKYKSVLSNYIVPMFGDFQLDCITTQSFQKKLLSIKSVSGRDDTFALLKDMYNKAFNLRYIAFNPLLAVEIKKHKKQRGTAFNREEEQKFVASCKKNKYGFIFLICLYSGLRIGEAMALNKSDICLRERVLKVSKTLWRNIIKSPKTETSIRTVPILDNLYPYVKRFSKNSEERICPVSLPVIYREFEKIIENSGLNNKKFKIHSLRHTFTTRCCENGMQAKVTQKWLGHATADMTMNVYTHINSDFELSETQKYNRRINESNT